MGFWDLSDGGTAANTGTEYEKPSGSLDPIPDGSTVLALIDEAKWDSPRDDDAVRFVSLRWSVIAPEQFKNRKLFHKLWIDSADPRAKDAASAAKKRDKDRRMLAAIDANAGGKLIKRDTFEDDNLAACLTNKPMVIKVMEWAMPDRERPGEQMRGNWIAAVAPKDRELHVAAAKPQPAKPAGGGAPAWAGGANADDDIPF